MAKPTYHRNYPDNRRWGDPQTQLKHAAGEIIEAAMASDPEEMLEELHDAQECIEGVFKRMEGVRPGITNETYVRHLAKEAGRGDYIPREA